MKDLNFSFTWGPNPQSADRNDVWESVGRTKRSYRAGPRDVAGRRYTLSGKGSWHSPWQSNPQTHRDSPPVHLGLWCSSSAGFFFYLDILYNQYHFPNPLLDLIALRAPVSHSPSTDQIFLDWMWFFFFLEILAKLFLGCPTPPVPVPDRRLSTENPEFAIEINISFRTVFDANELNVAWHAIRPSEKFWIRHWISSMCNDLSVLLFYLRSGES